MSHKLEVYMSSQSFMDNTLLSLPKNYWSKLNILETQDAIRLVRKEFQETLSSYLHLSKVQAPLLVRPETGLNDNLNGVEKPVQVPLRKMDCTAEVVQSLAKWKRLALKRYGFAPGTGIYTNMMAIRPDESPDILHSITVDQWDWEKIIKKQERTISTLKETAQKIVLAIKEVQNRLCAGFPQLTSFIHDQIFSITTQELEDLYPTLTPQEREYKICSEHKTVLILQIGGKLKSGAPHDGRAPDYDDWDLNGDLLIWSPLLQYPIEISSMGIRVDADSLSKQLKLSGCEERLSLPFHQFILQNKLPYTMGGGIGQSRLCMLLLEKAHIGEVQASVWPNEVFQTCEKHGVHLL